MQPRHIDQLRRRRLGRGQVTAEIEAESLHQRPFRRCTGKIWKRQKSLAHANS